MPNIRLLLFLCLFLFTFSSNSYSYENKCEWKELESLPAGKDQVKQLGLSAFFAGVSKGTVIVAGGCNFSEKPVIDNGRKVYHNDVFVFPAGEKRWIQASTLSQGIAYGASVSISDGLLCIGGNTGEEDLKTTFVLSWDNVKKKIVQIDYPNLPFPLSSCSAAVCNGYVYLVGSKSGDKHNNYFLRLNLKKRGFKTFKWEVLPDYPGPLRIDPLLVVQKVKDRKNIFVFGGYSPATERDSVQVAVTGLRYDPKMKVWKETSSVCPDNKKMYALVGSSALAIGSSHILFIGGVNREIFQKAAQHEYLGAKALTERETNDLKEWKKYYYSHVPEWFQFNKEVLIYHTITDVWSIGGNYPFPAPAGASIVPYQSGWMIINGEICPGIRSNKIYYGSITNKPIFGWENWTILLLYLLGMLFLGYYFMGKNKDTDDFFKGGGHLPWWATGMSLFATMLSAITFMAIPAKSYATDWKYFPMAITILIMVGPVIHYYLPFFRRLNVLTAYEYLEKRFNYVVRFMASTLFMIFMITRMALTLFLPSLALTTVTGIDIYLCIILMGIVTLIYCTMGGVEAVVWCDVIQGFILMTGALMTVIFLIVSIPGGVPEVLNIAIADDKFKMFDFAFNFQNATFWVILLGGLANNLISYTSDQTVIQRYIATESEKAAGKSILLNGILSLFVSIIFYFIGTGLYVFYKTHPENINFAMQNMDAIYPHYIMSEIPIGLAGLMIAAIFAATMSTISSNVNSLSTAFTVDIYRKFYRDSSDSKQLFVARCASVILGGIGVGVALLMARMDILSLFDFFNSLLGLLSSGVAALFVIGIFLPKIGSKAVILGFCFGNVLLLLISMFTSVSFLIYGFIGIILTVALSFIFSIFMPNRKNIEGYTWSTINKLENKE